MRQERRVRILSLRAFGVSSPWRPASPNLNASLENSYRSFFKIEVTREFFLFIGESFGLRLLFRRTRLTVTGRTGARPFDRSN
jgi:hypothetical protein